MKKNPIISNRKKNFSVGGVALGYDLPDYLVYLFKTLFVRPKVNIDFSLESGSTEFSFSYFSLVIKSDYKEIGHIDVGLVGNFYDIHKNKNIPFLLKFQDPPQIIESSETILLKCEPEIDFSNYLHKNSNIKLSVEYSYMFLGQVHSVSYRSTWGFDLKNEIQPSLILLTSKQTNS